MAIDTASPRSRRAVLAAALGAGVATVASALGRPAVTRAAYGDPVLAGKTTDTLSGSTVVKGAGNNGLVGWATAPTDLTNGVLGEADSTSGTGVQGWASAGTGNTKGVWGESSSTSGIGVYGYAAAASGATRGVSGAAKSPAGIGVHGEATSGTGVYATATTGYALRAVGRVKLDKCAGVATIAATKSSVVVTPGIDLVSTSAVVATLMGNAGSSTTVKRVAVNTTTNTFTIYLTANATANVKVAWHVFG